MDASVFSTGYGLDEGIPPYFTPLHTIPFHIQGRVLGKVNGKCLPLSNYKMDVWQIDPSAYSDSLSSVDSTTLRDKSCRGRTDSNAVIGQDGSYWFNTTMPASYGPPRHVNFIVTADGYETLITRMYIDRDYRLHQLATLAGHDETEATTLIDQHYQSPGYNRGFATDDDLTLGAENNYEAKFPGPIGRDPRVAQVSFRERGVTNVPDTPVYMSGYFSTEFNIVLQPLRSISISRAGKQNLVSKSEALAAAETAVATAILPLNITGLWADLSVNQGGSGSSSSGGLIKVDSFGSRFVAMEYPHPRSWGVVTGHLIADVVTGIDFRTSHIIPSLLNKSPQQPNRPASAVDMAEFLNDYDVESVKNYRNSIDITEPALETSASASASGRRLDDAGVNIIAGTDGLGTSTIEQKNAYKLNIVTPSVMTTGVSTGLIVSKDATTDSPMATTIHWHGPSGYAGTWSRREDLRGYRYLKLKVIRETGGYAGGKMKINEIRFYTGVISQNEVLFPDRKMKSPRTPFPQVVSCSSFQDQDHHCWKAFDGVDTSDSAWVTKPIGSKDHVLTEPQWILIDLGRGRSAFPTSVRITCDVGSSESGTGSSSSNIQGSGEDTVPSGCPMTFTVSGSYDNVKYDTVFAKDLNEYNNEYGVAQGAQLSLRAERESYNSSGTASVISTAGSTVEHLAANDITVKNSLHQTDVSVGLMFDFFWETPLGYPLGHRCGSCYTPPLFSCSLNSYDATCASGYCAASGLCGDIPGCPAGQYQERGFTGYNQPVFSCKQCPGGSYGAVVGLTDPSCSGLCQPGHYCPPGSASPTERKCGDSSVFCPEGSASPTRSSAGWKTTTGIVPVTNTVQLDTMSPAVSSTSSLDATSASTIVSEQVVQDGMYVGSAAERSAELLCSPGHYCRDGVELPCPIGTYGNDTGLQTAECSGRCIAGEHCAEGSVVPAICPKGSYCPDGMITYPCPAGTYGAMTGTKTPACSGACRVGHYCLQGSISSTEAKCPAGRYGTHPGLQDPLCSGLCAAGYYCPEGSTSSTSLACGSVNSYCPIGSAVPLPVDKGYYSAEGQVAESMSTQLICEAGFYCYHGMKYQCPTGTYGGTEGMHEGLMRVAEEEEVEAANTDMLLVEVTPPTTASPTSTPTVASPLRSEDDLPWALCSGFCERGFFCPVNSTSPRQVPCPAGRYGNRAGLENELCTAFCPMGHYCPQGSVVPIPCRAGIFGNTTGLTSAHCNPRCYDNDNRMGVIEAVDMTQQQQLHSSQFGNDNCRDNLCEAGYYCPEGSVSGKQRECGSSGELSWAAV